jgi:peptide/nickel transport system permease protein
VRLAQYVLKRVLLLIPVAVGVLVVTFFVGRVLPGDPMHLLLPPDADQRTIDQVRKELGLDKSIPVQFVLYLRDLIKGDLGKSIHTGNTVVQDIEQRFPATFELVTLGLIVSIILSIPLGVIAAVRRDGMLDHASRLFSLLGVSLPSFWLALLLIYFLFFKLGWAPAPLGRGPIGFGPEPITGLHTVDTLLRGDVAAFATAAKYLVLPVFTLAVVNMAPLTRLTRASMIEALNSEHVRFAFASGLPRRTIYFRLALKNALIAPVTMIGIIYGYLLGGVVLVEAIFAWPGLGLWAVNAAVQNDYAPVQGFALLAAASRVVVFLATDLVYFAIDPRIRY